jgi:hypothetical protein
VIARAARRRKHVVGIGVGIAATAAASCALVGGIADLPYPADAAVVESGVESGPRVDASTDGGCSDAQSACSGACVDLTQSAASCGRCGHDCQGGKCQSGVCQPLVLGSIANGAPAGLVVRGGTVYFAEVTGGDGQILTVPTGGGGFDVLVHGTSGPAGYVTTDGTRLYWTHDTVLAAVLFDGGGLAQLGMTTTPWGVAVNASDAFWTDFANPGNVLRTPIDGGTTVTLNDAQENPGAVVVDATSVYWTASGAGAVAKASLDGGSPALVASGIATPQGMAVDATRLYVAGADAVYAIPVGTENGQPAPLLAETNGMGMAVDSTAMYWLAQGTGPTTGTVKMLPFDALDAGTPVTLATGQPTPTFIALDANSVYWTSSAFGGPVTKVAKP